jgi:hypothetical protein
MNHSLSQLEERFCEYKFKPKSNTNNSNQINQNIQNNNNNIQRNNANDNNNNQIELNDIIGDDILFNNSFLVRNSNPFLNSNPFIGLISYRINQTFPDKEKLLLLEDSFIDTNQQFLKLINFYKLSTEITELYDINSLENKYLNNLLLSLYNIIFSPNNISKIEDNNNKNYKALLNNINEFFIILINNIYSQKNKKLLIELAKQRNILHFKEILQIMEKFNPQKMEKEENNNKYQSLKNFIERLENTVPEEETIKAISIGSNNNNNGIEDAKNGTKIDDKNLCSICADSVIDTHILPCGHQLCRNCLFQCLTENKICPFCRIEIKGIKEDPNFKI